MASARRGLIIRNQTVCRHPPR